MKKYQIFQTITGITILEGMVVIAAYFGTSAKTSDAVLGSYSALRLMVGFGLLIILVAFLCLFAASIIWAAKLKTMAAQIKNALNSDIYRPMLVVPLFFSLAINLLALSIHFFPATGWAIPIIRTYALISVITERLYIAQIWIVLILVQTIVFYVLTFDRFLPRQHQLSWLPRTAIYVWVATGFILAFSIFWGVISRNIPFQFSNGPVFKLAVISIWLTIWAYIEQKQPDWVKKHWKLFLSVSVWMAVFLASLQLGHWLDVVVTPRESFWHLLADSFLQGKLYLPNPPSIQDLVLYNGHWYIPIPPLPAFVMLPLVAIFGVHGINTTLVSLCLAALTSMLVFLILEELANLKWIEVGLSGRLWLTGLFAFGTVQLWLSIVSRVWYFAQICAILFVAISFLMTLKKMPAWFATLFLGLAMLSRPNLFTLWPALAAITIQLNRGNQWDFKKMLRWVVFSALPLIAAAGFLLLYNYLRFGDFLNFGYTDIYVGGSVVSGAQKFGIFNLEFFQTNLQSMFVTLPELTSQCNYYLARGHGISMLAATPAILYIFRRLKMEWWTIGCWVSVIITMGLLLMYHNDGSIQFAYRYSFDFMLPIILLIAANAREKISWQLKLLILASVVINYFGTVSWYFSTC